MQESRVRASNWARPNRRGAFPYGSGLAELRGWLLACALALRASILPIESRFRTMTLKMHRHRPL